MEFDAFAVFGASDALEIEKRQAVLVIDLRKGLAPLDFSLFVQLIAQCADSLYALFLDQVAPIMCFQHPENHPVRLEIGFEEAGKTQQFSETCSRYIVRVGQCGMGHEYGVINKGL